MIPAAPAASPSLFLVVLGGRVPAAHIELHDVRFVVGATIDDTLPALRRQWFGARRGLHLDSWMRVRSVAGYRVELRPEPFTGAERLWFVNMGGYDPAQLAERHAFGLVVATSAQAARVAARRQLLPDALHRHLDDLHGVEAALAGATGAGAAWAGTEPALALQHGLELDAGAGGRQPLALHLIPDGSHQPLLPDWYGYRPI